MVKVYVDAGHGGTDPGAVCAGQKESVIVLNVAKHLQAELQRQGIAVKMSREADTSKTLAQRTEEANSFGADLVISIHCNAFSNLSASGTETYIYKKGGNAEKIAAKVHPLLIAAFGTKDRGIKEGNLAMVRDTDAPAILCELAFITNAADRAKLTTATIQKNAAAAICKGVCAYLNITYKGEKKMEFKDYNEVPQWAKDEKIVEQAVSMGIVKGDENAMLRPNDPITRIEAMAMIVRVVK